MSDETTGTFIIPMWVRILIMVSGIIVVFYEMLTEPRWPLLLVAMAMMGLVSPDFLDRWKRGSP